MRCSPQYRRSNAPCRRRWMRGDVLARWCGLILFLLVAVPCAGEYRTTEVASLRIVMDSDWVTITAPGYVPVRFDITNVGDARVIEIVGESLRFSRSMRSGPSNTRTEIRQALRMARGDRVRLTIAVPVSGDGETIHFRIVEDGRTLEDFTYYGLQSAVAATNAAVLIIADESSPFGKAAASWPPRPYSAPMGYLMGVARAGAPRSAGRGAAGPKLDVLLEPSRLPATWLGYTSLRA